MDTPKPLNEVSVKVYVVVNVQPPSHVTEEERDLWGKLDAFRS